MTLRVHAGCVAIGGRGVLIAGASGSGKSDLALRLIDRGARLVSDDYSQIEASGGRLVATAPASIAGKIEIRGVGIVEIEALASALLCLHVDLDAVPARMVEPGRIELEGLVLPSIALAGLEASAPIKLEQALRHFGLSLP